MTGKVKNAETLAKPRAGRGGVVPPKERQFGQPNGNKSGRGFWKKEDTARYKLEQMLKLSFDELELITNDPNAPLFERRIANSLIKEKDWKITESMINQVYGAPKQEITTTVQTPTPLVDLTKRKKNGKNNGTQ